MMCGFMVCKGFDRPLVEAAAQTFSFRGPDHTGVTERGDFICVHHRLAIIGLGADNDQPFVRGDDLLLYNGEIFNYRTLRETYFSDRTFTSDGDVEVFYNLVKSPALIDKVHGFFAYVLISPDRLVFERDLLGQKPLYYFSDGRRFAASSDIRAFECLLGNELTLSPEAIDDILDFTHCEGARTIYAEVKTLLPGERGTIDTAGLTFTRRPQSLIWDSCDEPVGRSAMSRSIDEVTTADVPAAIALSSGFDSQIIEQNSDAFSLAVTIDYSTIAESKLFQFTSDYPRQVIPFRKVATAEQIARILDIFGQPFGNPTALYLDIICSQVRAAGMKLLVTGELGDELLLGYPRHKIVFRYGWLRYVMPLRLLPLSWRQVIVDRAKGARVKKALMYFLAPEHLKSAVGYQYHYNFKRLRPVDAHGANGYQASVHEDLSRFVPSNLFVISDAVGMRNGVEVRTPFADKRLFASVDALPRRLLRCVIAAKSRAAEIFNLRFMPTLSRSKIGFNPPHQDVLDDSVDIEQSLRLLADRLPFAAERLHRLAHDYKQDPAAYTQVAFAVLTLAAFLKARPNLQPRTH